MTKARWYWTLPDWTFIRLFSLCVWYLRVRSGKPIYFAPFEAVPFDLSVDAVKDPKEKVH